MLENHISKERQSFERDRLTTNPQVDTQPALKDQVWVRQRMLPILCARGAIALLIALAAGSAINQSATAQPSHEPSGSMGSVSDLLYFPRASERFFEEGRVQLEQEIQTLMQQRYAQPETLLELSNDVTIQDDLLRLEDPDLQPIPPQEHNFLQPH